MRFLVIIPALLIVLLPVVSLAQEQFLVGIPGLSSGADRSFNDYINTLYAVCISLAALLAVVKIIIAGVKYMFSDIVTDKGDAKRDIRGALIGLGIIISAVLILSIINPELTRFNLDVEQVPRAERNISAELARAIKTQPGRSTLATTDPELVKAFIIDCLSGESKGIPKYTNVNEISCIRATIEEKSKIADLTSVVSNDVDRASLQREIELNILPHSFDEDTIEAIRTTENLEEIFFLVDSSGFSQEEVKRLAEICEQLLTASGHTYNGDGDSYSSNSLVFAAGGLTSCGR